jgi:hypothetical protein
MIAPLKESVDVNDPKDKFPSKNIFPFEKPKPAFPSSCCALTKVNENTAIAVNNTFFLIYF